MEVAQISELNIVVGKQMRALNGQQSTTANNHQRYVLRPSPANSYQRYMLRPSPGPTPFQCRDLSMVITFKFQIP
jgi:hypothetical protein